MHFVLFQREDKDFQQRWYPLPPPRGFFNLWNMEGFSMFWKDTALKRSCWWEECSGNTVPQQNKSKWQLELLLNVVYVRATSRSLTTTQRLTKTETQVFVYLPHITFFCYFYASTHKCLHSLLRAQKHHLSFKSIFLRNITYSLASQCSFSMTICL